MEKYYIIIGNVSIEFMETQCVCFGICMSKEDARMWIKQFEDEWNADREEFCAKYNIKSEFNTGGMIYSINFGFVSSHFLIVPQSIIPGHSAIVLCSQICE